MNTEEDGHKFYAPKRAAMLPKIPTPDPALAEFNKGLENITSKLNEETKPFVPPAHPPYQFVSLAEKCAEALVQTAEQAVNEAQNTLEAVRAYADKLRQEIKDRDAELGKLTGRLQALGSDALEAHKRFHGGEGQ